MARRRRRDEVQRDDFTIANPTLLFRPSYVVDRGPLLSDDRTYHPDDPFRPAVSHWIGARDVVDRNVNKSSRKSRVGRWDTLHGFGFRVPNAVNVCIRRKQRKEVLFALRKTGRGAGAPRRRNRWSDVRC